MLSGLYPPTEGDAIVNKLSIRTDITSIYSDMGVCNQHDILWGDLSGIDHLLFYGRLKGITGPALKEAVNKALASVNLTRFGRWQAKNYSGGMKRRLSVACSLIGGPAVTYLDEPSTGLDPASRHNLWDVIIASKQNRSLILTTHSMEEADVLCDRIGIMDKGQMQCLGKSHELKHRFGAGYTIALTSADHSQESMEALLKFISTMCPSAALLNEPIAGTMKLEIRSEEIQLSKFFKDIESNKAQYQITDWGITETTLEEVFLKVTSERRPDLDRANSLMKVKPDPKPAQAAPKPEAKAPEPAQPEAAVVHVASEDLIDEI
jgi:ABC-type multidrug transport system ATPase subunit